MSNKKIVNGFIKEGFVLFSFGGIRFVDGVKKPISMLRWQSLTKENFQSLINYQAPAFGIKTGACSNLTVIDFDNPNTYDKITLEHPELKNLRTIKTKKGYHIYCLFDPDFYSGNSGTNVLQDDYDGVDLRANNGIAFCPPTKYYLEDGSLFKYEDLGGQILPIPQIFHTLLKTSPSSKKTIKIKGKIPIKIKTFTLSPEEKKIAEKATQYFKQYHPDSILTEVFSHNPIIDIFKFSKSSHPCLICETPDQSDNQYIEYNRQSHQFFYKCHDGNHNNQMLLMTNQPHQYITPNEIINQPQLPDYDFHDKKCLMIEANMGTGKTKMLIKHIAQLPKDAKIIILSCRRALSREFLAKFGPYGVQSYLDIKGDLDQDRLIVQIDSLYRLKTERCQWDYLIIDEIDSILEHFNSNLMKHKSICSEVFNFLIETCQKTIMLDAHINTKRVSDFVKSKFNQDHYYLKNTFIRKTNRHIFLHQDEVSLSDQLIKSIKAHKKCAIVSSSKYFLDKVEQIIKPLTSNYQFYTSETDTQQLQADIANVNQSWSQFQIVGFSPSITMGVSFEQSHFDQLFVYGKGGGCTYLGLLQMMGRVRKLKEGSIHMFLSPETNNLPIKINEIINFLKHRSNIIHNNLGENLLFRRKLNHQGQFYYPDQVTWEFQLYVNNLQVTNMSINNFKKLILSELARLQIPMSYVDKPDNSEVKETMKEAKKQIKLDLEQKISSVTDISDTDFEQLKNKKEQSQNEKLILLKHHCQSVYHTQDIKGSDYNYERCQMFINREKVTHSDLPDQLELIIHHSLNNDLHRVKTFSDFTNFQHKHTWIALSYVLLCKVLHMPNLLRETIDKIQWTGQQIHDAWSAQKDLFTENIETWSLMRPKARRITPETISNWGNLDFIRFTNSIIENHLGLKIYAEKHDKHNYMNSLYQIEDSFTSYTLIPRDLEEPDLLPKGQCQCE